MEYKKFMVNRQSCEEARKPVYVLSEQYDNISSDEDETTFAMKTEESPWASDYAHSNEWNFLDDVSVNSLEIPSDSFVNELLENTEEDAVDEHTPETEDCLLDSSASEWSGHWQRRYCDENLQFVFSSIKSLQRTQMDERKWAEPHKSYIPRT